MQDRTTRWRRAMLAAAAVAAMLPATAGAATQAEIDAAIADGAAFLASRQQADGSLSGFGGDWAVTSLAAAGVHAADTRPGPAGPSLQDWVVDWHAANPYGIDYGAIPSAESGGSLGKAMLIARAAGVDPARVSPSVNLVASLAGRYDPVGGTFGSAAANADGFAALALGDLDRVPPALVDRVVRGVRAAQHADGGWSISPTAGATTEDVDMTGAGLAVLCGTGADAGDPQVAAALDWMRARQDEATGAFAVDAPWVPRLNAPSNAWALTGLRACGVDPQSPAWTTASGGNVVDWLLGLQKADGSFRHTPDAGEDPAPAYDTNATEATVRALAGTGFSAEPPGRADPSDPAWRPAAEVAPGTPVPVAIAIADGSAPRFCAVTVGDGTALVDVLAAARDAAVAAGCVEAVSVEAGAVASLNGVDPAAGSAWLARIDGEDAGVAGSQEIGFGDTVWLRVGADPRPRPQPQPQLPLTPQPQLPLATQPQPQPSPEPSPASPWGPVTPPGGEAAPSPEPPSVDRPRVVRLDAPRRVRVGRRGRFALVASCPPATSGRGTCEATLRLAAKVGGRWRVMGRRTVTVRAGGERRVRLRIRRRFLRDGALRVRIARVVDGERRGRAARVEVVVRGRAR